MPASRSSRVFHWLATEPLVRLVAYYLILLATGLSLSRFAPEVLSPDKAEQAPGSLRDLIGQDPTAAVQAVAVHEAIVAMVAAFLLMVPVAGVYYLSRRTRGYAQSLMHTLLILPIVVAGVVILVKASVALAFSLGGIVGAIAFRNRLEDTKDAVHVFVAISVGLAAGVQATNIAFALSFIYNLVNVALWIGDIGRTPPGLVGPAAQARVEGVHQAVAAGGNDNKEALVSRIDTLLLKSMSPAQLGAVVKRADKRRRNLAEQIEAEPETNGKPRRWVRIKLFIPIEQPKGSRPDPDAALGRIMREYQLETSSRENGHSVLVYHGKVKKRIDPADVAAEVKAALGAAADKVEVVDG